MWANQLHYFLVKQIVPGNKCTMFKLTINDNCNHKLIDQYKHILGVNEDSDLENNMETICPKKSRRVLMVFCQHALKHFLPKTLVCALGCNS